MKKNVRITPSVAHVQVDDHFAVISRIARQDEYSINLSIPATARMSDLLDNSAIVEVTSFNRDGVIYFKRRPFFETHILIDLVSDILERHISDLKHEEKYRLL